MDGIKKSWSNLAKNERIGLITGTVCSLVIVCLCLAAREAINKVLPYVMAVGIVLFAAEALFFWNRNRRHALSVGIVGPVMCIVLLIMMLTGSF